MERYSDEAIRIIDELHTERLDYQSEYIPLIDAAQRLDAYESTGMEPENIGALYEELNQYKEIGDLDRLRELMQADREGRCVVHGKWVVGGVHGNGVIGNWKCDICKGVSLKETLYCPNCGAKMDLEDK